MPTGTNGQITQWQTRRGTWRGWKETDVEPIGSTNTQTGHPDGSNKLVVCLELFIPNNSTIKSVTSLTVPVYAGVNSSNSDKLYGIIRTVAPLSDSSETLATITETNTVGQEGNWELDKNGWGSKSTLTLYGTFSVNTTYYLYLYTKNSNITYRFEPYESANYPFSYEYTARATYSIKYDANDGTGAPASQTKTEDIALTLSSTKPTKADSTNTITGSFNITGDAYGGYFGTTTTTTTKITASTSRTDTIKYTFNEWNTVSDGSGTSYAAGANYTANAAATLYAQYTSSTTTGTTTYTNNSIGDLAKPSRNNSTQATYTITYVYGNGSSNSTATCKKNRVYNFKGWSETKGGTILSNSTTYTSAKTVYAFWEEIDSTESATLPTPTKTGYTFMGWSTNQNASSGSTGSYTPTDNVTLYAIWKTNGGAVRIYIDGQGYKMAQVYLYANNKWNLTIPYLYDSSWHISS